MLWISTNVAFYISKPFPSTFVVVFHGVPSVHFTHFAFQVIGIQFDWQTFEKVFFVSRDLKLQEILCKKFYAKGKTDIGTVESNLLAIIQNKHLIIILTLSIILF